MLLFFLGDTLLHEGDEDSAELLCWLRNNVEPWGQIETFWTKTFRARQKEIKKTAIYDYYSTYRVLRENRGFTLVSIHFILI